MHCENLKLTFTKMSVSDTCVSMFILIGVITRYLVADLGSYEALS